MSEPRRESGDELARTVEAKERRRLRGRAHRGRSTWFGLGMFGMVGWSVVVPTLTGLGVGVWIDRSAGSRFSWTLMLLFAGLFLGCFNAWYWISRERRQIEREREDDG